MYLLGLSVTFIAIGALLGETLFAFIASLIGISVGVGAVVWIVLGAIILFISVSSIEEVNE
jgi:hypothetical protein